MRMRTSAVVLGALVPAVINIPFPYVTYFATIISLLVVITVSLESVYHYREQWKNYRSAEQLLGREKYLFRARLGSYQDKNPELSFKILVDRVEQTIASENAATLSTLTTSADRLPNNASH